MDYSPIVCFGFDRPNHLDNMLKSLENNIESKNSIVYICIDGPTNETDVSMHKKTVDIANKNWDFKHTEVITRENNLDCRTNIITTISELFEKYEKLIILEDDLFLGEYFLDYMNKSLNKYQEHKDVWHVNGYTYPQINLPWKSSVSTYVSPWGWGTWRDRWNIFINENYDKHNFISELSETRRKEFNYEDLYDWENIIIKNELGVISAWDAYWYQAIFLKGGFSIFPNKSHVKNKGFDGTGMHCSENDDWKTPLNKRKTITFQEKISINKLFKLNAMNFYRYYIIKRYFRYHKTKFESFSNFKEFIYRKIKL